MTLEILDGIKKMGLKIPDDVALVGYDETIWSKYLDPSLTTVKQPAYKMGELATKKLIQLIESKNKENELAEIISLEPDLIQRDSCGGK